VPPEDIQSKDVSPSDLPANKVPLKVPTEMPTNAPVDASSSEDPLKESDKEPVKPVRWRQFKLYYRKSWKSGIIAYDDYSKIDFLFDEVYQRQQAGTISLRECSMFLEELNNCEKLISDLAPAAKNTRYQFYWNVDAGGASERGEPFSNVLSKF